MEETIRDMLTVTEVFKSGKYNEKEDSEVSSKTYVLIDVLITLAPYSSFADFLDCEGDLFKTKTVIHCVVYLLYNLLAHSLAHFLAHSFTYSLTHLLTHSVTHSLIYSLTHSHAH